MRATQRVGDHTAFAAAQIIPGSAEGAPVTCSQNILSSCAARRTMGTRQHAGIAAQIQLGGIGRRQVGIMAGCTGQGARNP